MTRPTTETVNLNRRAEGVGYAVVLMVLGWWIYNLQFHWRSSPEMQFGWIVLLLTGYLVWELWAKRPATTPENGVGSLVVCTALAVPCLLFAELFRHAIGRVPSSTFVLSIACALLIAGLLWWIGGRGLVLFLVFPLCFMFVGVPLPKILWNPVVFALQDMITWVNVEILTLFGVPAVQTGNVIRLPNCIVGVDEACSGIRSLQSSIMVSLFVGYLMFDTLSKRALLFAGGILAAVVGNAVRSLYLSMTAFRSGPEALENAHDAAGWGIMVFTLVALGLIVWLMDRLQGLRNTPMEVEKPSPNPHAS